MSEIRLGSINGSHGVKGWIKVFSYTEPMEAILEYSPWTLRKGSKERQVTLEQGQKSGKRLIARIEGIDSREMADELIGYDILVDQQMLAELEDGEFYWYQLEGLTVRNTGGEILGEVSHLLETGANDVLVVVPTRESVDDQQRLIPYVEPTVVQQVDLATRNIVVDWETDY